MLVRMDKKLRAVLNEAHERQIEETLGRVLWGSEGFYGPRQNVVGLLDK